MASAWLQESYWSLKYGVSLDFVVCNPFPRDLPEGDHFDQEKLLAQASNVAQRECQPSPSFRFPQTLHQLELTV